MSSGLYKNGIREIQRANIDLINATISGALIDASTYTPDLDNDISLDDVGEDNLIQEAELINKSLDGTAFRADDLVFPSVDTGQTVNAVLLYLDTDTLEESFLIAYIDNAPEFPITTDGTDITIAWDTGANGIFKF